MTAKRMIMTAAMAAILGFVPSAYGDVSVIDIKCTPRSPWNGLVDVEYTVACDDPNADVYVNPVAYDGDRRLTMFPSSFTGDGATNTVKAGKHSMVWDAAKDLGTFSSANFQLKMYAGKRLARYVVVDLSSGSSSTNYPVRFSHVGPDLSDDTCRTTELWLRLVPPGEFWMGSPADEFGRDSFEDLHHVTFTKPFYIGVFEVTMQQWMLVQGGWYNYWGSPSYSSSSEYIYCAPEFSSSTNWSVRPVNQQAFAGGNNEIRGSQYPNATTGFDSDSFFARLRSRAKVSGFDLPTESRWEYACRAGTMTALYNGKNISDTVTSAALAEIAAYYGNRFNDARYSDESVSIGTTPVGSFRPNALGLYDMLGNVWELCRDGFPNDISGLGTEKLIDPPALGGDGSWGKFIRRGGWWKSPARECRAAQRWWSSLTDHNVAVGFRVCAEAEF